ncbi:MAG: hypothetical protein K6B38_13600 [Ruminococcus sp.]|nr:hypothetical protein [Ruminococcus sp.]
MNENGKLQNILHCTDNDTIDKIAEKYTLSDEATSQRVYERCVQKMMAKKDENSGYTEMFTTEKYKRRTLLRIAGLSAACIAVMSGVFLGLRNMKPPVPEKGEESSVLFEVTNVTSTVTTDSDAEVTTSITNAKKTSAGSLTSVTDGTVSTMKTSQTTDSQSTVKTSQNTASQKKENNSVISSTVKSNANSAKQDKAADAVKTTTQAAVEAPTVTTLSQEEQERRIKEIEEKGKYHSRHFPRETAVALGEYPSDAPRLSYEEAQQIAARCETKNEFKEELAKVYPYPDFRDVGSQQYWFDNEGSEYLNVRNSDDATLIVYTRDTSNDRINDIDNLDWKKAVLIAPDLRKLEEIKADEAKNGYIRVFDRAELGTNVYNYRPPLEEVRGEDFASFFKNLRLMYQCPDTWAENGKTVLTYKDKNAEGYLSIVPEEGLVTYIKYDDPDNCEVIMQDKGCVSNEDMADLKEFWNHIVSMTD